jgi:hypothetical protein
MAERQQIKIQPEEIKIERIDEHHSLNHLHSYEPELIGFLKEDALENQKKQDFSNLFVVFEDRTIGGICHSS